MQWQNGRGKENSSVNLIMDEEVCCCWSWRGGSWFWGRGWALERRRVSLYLGRFLRPKENHKARTRLEASSDETNSVRLSLLNCEWDWRERTRPLLRTGERFLSSSSSWANWMLEALKNLNPKLTGRQVWGNDWTAPWAESLAFIHMRELHPT